ncbi:MAG: AraC family transcriptional regulator [Vallitaleaceae bacterium]|nr:AraC family transcriptional regulator [Vallitaleaceae bacterium]
MFKEYQSKSMIPSEYDAYINLYPSWIGYLSAMPNYRCNSRILDDYFMIYVNKGSGTFRCQGQEYPLKKNDLFFLFPNVVHNYCTYEMDLLELWWIGFNGTNSLKLLSDLSITPQSPILSLENGNPIYPLIENMFHHYKEFSTAAKIKASGNLYEIFGTLLERDERSCEKPELVVNGTTKPIEKALAYIDTNYTNQFTMVHLANYIGLNRTYFSTRFRKEVGCTPSEYLNKIRLNQAKYYLVHTTLPIGQIAHSVGFTDALYFSKLFDLHTGYSPTVYRKMNPPQIDQTHVITKSSL